MDVGRVLVCQQQLSPWGLSRYIAASVREVSLGSLPEGTRITTLTIVLYILGIPHPVESLLYTVQGFFFGKVSTSQQVVQILDGLASEDKL